MKICSALTAPVAAIVLMTGCSKDPDYGSFSEVEICKAVMATDFRNIEPHQMQSAIVRDEVQIWFTLEQTGRSDRYWCSPNKQGRIRWGQLFPGSRSNFRDQDWFFQVDNSSELTITIEFKDGSRPHVRRFTASDFTGPV